MRTRKLNKFGLLAVFLHALIFGISCKLENNHDKTLPDGRLEYELELLADPRTGKIPDGIRLRELAYASTLPRSNAFARSGNPVFNAIGPYNIGGRTRAMALDLKDTANIIAGGVSGGMWKSVNSGKTWVRTTAMDEVASVACVKQDPRQGKEHIWYYGTGERRANSASASGAHYSGNGIYKSTNNADSWQHISSTFSQLNRDDDWTAVFNIAVDPTRNDSDVILCANLSGIMRSADGGTTWTRVLGGSGLLSPSWSNVIVSTTGVFYAHLSSDGGSGGIYRSSDGGLNWTNISAGFFPSTHQRALLELAPSNENNLYVFVTTPNSGQLVNPDDQNSDRLSFFKYSYLSGDGAAASGIWEDRSSNIPASTTFNQRLVTFSNYCMQLKIKPDNEDIIFLGGTSIFRSMDGFSSDLNTAVIGGYTAQGYASYNYVEDGQHPDQHEICFYPQNPKIMLASSDGGVHRTDDCEAFKVLWNDLNNGFVTTQFYAVATVHDMPLDYAVGGMQDNGTWMSNSNDFYTPWDRMRGGDGAFCALTNGGNVGYFSTQRANIRKFDLIPQQGVVLGSQNIMPDFSWATYRFVHPFTMDPNNADRMYLPIGDRLFRNDAVVNNNAADLWQEVAAVDDNRQDITAVSPSFNNDGIVYVGTNNQRIFRIENATTANPTIHRIDNGIRNGGYTNSIAVDPQNSDNLLVVFTNYNARSLWYSQDAGQTWEDVEGNLIGEPDDPTAPEDFWYIGSGPSIRWARILPINEDSNMYILGTSVGLFISYELDGANTEWVQQSPDLIGNAVVHMVDVRLSDGFTVIGTHGNGVYTGKLLSPSVGLESFKKSNMLFDFDLYPNPASDFVNIRSINNLASNMKISIFSQSGQLINQFRQHLAPNETIEIPIRDLSSGIYFIKVKCGKQELIKKLSVL